jgi:hypothetical protein
VVAGRLPETLVRDRQSGASRRRLQLDTWFSERANPRVHKTLRCRPIDRLIEERAVMAPRTAIAPDTERRWVLRVPPDPCLRVDTCDYSLDLGLVSRRVEARVTDTEC